MGASPRNERAAQRTAMREQEDELAAVLRKPWRGQADKVRGPQIKVLAQFEERGVKKPVLSDGVQINVAMTKYWCKYDGDESRQPRRSRRS
eukprot:277789-Prymnesium_polylepis.1